MTNQETIKQFFDQVIKDLKADQVSKGIVSSGRSAKSLEAIAEPESGQLLGAAYWQQQTTGRKPGKFPPIDSILQWISDKGIQSDIEPKSLAFLIARKISKVGTDIYQGKSDGIEFEKITTSNLELFKQNLLKGTAEQIVINIKKAIK